MSRFFRFCKDIKEIITNADKRNVLLLRMSIIIYINIIYI